MIICGVDFETTGLIPEKHGVNEVGAVLWDAESKSPLRVEGFIVDPGDVEWDDEAIAVSGITKELVAKHGIESEDALSRVLYMMERADAVCAHNGTVFDRPMFEAWCKRAGAKPHDKLWIDTCTDIEFPAEISTRKLTYLAAEHWMLNFFGHRAVFDVMTMLQVLSRYDIERVIYLAKQPSVTVIACVSYDDRQLAKDRGYRWQPAPKKTWEKNIKECFLEQEKAEAGFKVLVLRGE